MNLTKVSLRKEPCNVQNLDVNVQSLEFRFNISRRKCKIKSVLKSYSTDYTLIYILSSFKEQKKFSMVILFAGKSGNYMLGLLNGCGNVIHGYLITWFLIKGCALMPFNFIFSFISSIYLLTSKSGKKHTQFLMKNHLIT